MTSLPKTTAVQEERQRFVSPLIQRVLDRRLDRSYAGWTASVRRAVAPATEVAAYGAVESLVPSGLSRTQASGLRRAAAICAGAKGAPQDSSAYASIGQAFARLQRTLGGSHVEQRVQTLPLLDMENAAISLGHLVDLCAQHHVAVDFHDLARTLTYWGDGLGERSQETRRRLVRDFYTTGPETAAGALDITDLTAQEGTTR